MKTFTVKLPMGNLEAGLIISPLDEQYRQFRVERITGENNPVILTRSDRNTWLIDNPGQWDIPKNKFKELGRMIDARLDKIARMKVMLALTDFSEAASNAARYAAGLTHQLGFPGLILYHSYVFKPISMNITKTVLGKGVDTPEKSRGQLNDLRNQLKDLVSKQTTIEIHADELPLVSGVNALAEQQDAGLVVVGTTGKSNLELLVGSHTLTLAKECHAPLLIVPRSARFEKIRRIAFACNLKMSPVTVPLSTLKTLVDGLGAQLIILNVDHHDSYYFDADKLAGQTMLNEQWDNEKLEYHYITHKDAAKGIMQFADQQDIQLVITVPRKYGFFESLFHRSVTKKLAFHTHIPLLLLKEAAV